MKVMAWLIVTKEGTIVLIFQIFESSAESGAHCCFIFFIDIVYMELIDNPMVVIL